MENIRPWRGQFIKMEEEEETTETKPQIKAQIPFLADLIKLQQQLMKSEVNDTITGCSSWVCKEEIIDADEIDLGKDVGQTDPYLEDTKIHVKDEPCASDWNYSGNSRDSVQQMQSQCGTQHFQLVGQDTFSETLSEHTRNNERIKQETEDGNFEDTAETTEIIHLSPTPRGQGENGLTEPAFGDGACSKLSGNDLYASMREVNCDWRSKGSKSLYTCDVPGECVTDLSSLITQKKGHSKKKSYKCDVCGKECSDNSKLIIHKRTHTGEKPYKCDVCGKGFSEKSKLVNHERTHTGEKPYKCDVCGKGFSENRRLETHKRTHTGEKPYKCDVCGKGYIGKGRLEIHKRIHTVEKLYKCNVCDIVGWSDGSKSLNKCDVCGEGVTELSSLITQEKGQSKKSHKCDVCGKECRDNSKLIIHKRTHTGEKPYKCDVCGKGLSEKYILVIHKRTHTEEKPYKCDVCGKGFFETKKLESHKRIHTGERPYKCDVCGKGYTEKWGLEIHKRIHTRERP